MKTDTAPLPPEWERGTWPWLYMETVLGTMDFFTSRHRDLCLLYTFLHRLYFYVLLILTVVTRK